MSAWEAWKAYPEVTEAFLNMVSHPHNCGVSHFHLLEHFTVIRYDKTSDLKFVKEAQKSCFARRIGLWKIFHQCRILSYNMASVLATWDNQ